MENSNSIKNKTILGLFWSFCDIFSTQGLQFIIQIILARLLLPKDFGIIGMIMIFIAISNTFINCGFSQALIREKNVSKEEYSTVFFFNILMSTIIYFILFVSAEYISIFFNEPQLVPILRVLSLMVIITSLGLTHRTILTKNIDFKIQTKISVFSSIIAGFVAIAFAYYGYGVWSIVFNILVMQFIQVLMLWLSTRWFPVLVFKVDVIKRLFRFSSRLLLSSLIDTVYNNINSIIIGKFFSASQLGYYTTAAKIQETTSQVITFSVQRVSYPVLSSIQDDKIKLKASFKKIIRISIFLNFPLMIGLSAISSPLINIFLGDKWMPAVPYLQLLCFAGMLYPLHAINLNILQVKGRSDLFLRLELIKKIISAITIAIVLCLELGIMGLIGASVVMSFIAFFINSYYSEELISYSIKEQLMDIIPIFSVSILMALIVHLSNFVLLEDNLIKLSLQVVFGILAYIIICKLVDIEELYIIYDIILPVINVVKVRFISIFFKNKLE